VKKGGKGFSKGCVSSSEGVKTFVEKEITLESQRNTASS